MKTLRNTKGLVNISEIKTLIELNRKINELRYHYWFTEVIFTLNWWVLLFLTVIPWLIWWKIADKKRLVEVLLYGILISLISVLLDEIGSYFSFWIYQYQLIPISPRLNPIDLTVMPVTYMVVYQFFKKWRPFLIAQLVLSLGAAFVAEPLFIWMGIYKPLNWELFYSSIIYFAMGVLTKWWVEHLLRIQTVTNL